MSEKRGEYNAGFTLTLPMGLERAVARVLLYHIGRERAISREGLVAALAMSGFKVSEREARAAINELRKQGRPICSTGGEKGGYWWAANWEELNEYIERELHSRAMDLLEQERALRAEAEKEWGRFSPQRQYRMEV
jgi:hypothetical protein